MYLCETDFIRLGILIQNEGIDIEAFNRAWHKMREEQPPRPHAGHPKIYATAADRQRAYRQRKKLQNVQN
jgi:hypothetical protein